jgi:glutamine amidotransferase
MLGASAERDPVRATVRTLATVADIARASGAPEPVRFTAARTLYAFRYASDDSATSLYYRDTGDHVVVVSEPLDKDTAFWRPVPPSHLIVAHEGERTVLRAFPPMSGWRRSGLARRVDAICP